MVYITQCDDLMALAERIERQRIATGDETEKLTLSVREVNLVVLALSFTALSGRAKETLEGN
jgi:hypothetical protein